jgi:CubicO group peptidase (beta-lactamase class C family)
MAAMLVTRRPTDMPGLEIGLGWHILTKDGREIIWHNGGTGGFRTFIAFDPKGRTGVVALSNTSTTTGVDDIGRHLLNSTFPLAQPPKEHKQVAVDPKLFDKYVGRYELAPTFVVTVTREGDRLFGQATGQSKFEMFAEGEKDYFLKIVDAQITFEADNDGKVTGLTLHQNGANKFGKRVE